MTIDYPRFGMIETVEWDMLYQAAQKLREDDYILEYGTFLGASTFALAAGLSESVVSSFELLKPRKRLCSYDLYQCHKSTIYGKLVRKAADHYSMQINDKDGVYFYRPVVEEIIKPFRDIVMLEEGYIQDARIPKGFKDMNLMILHLDAPKDWNLLKEILAKAFPLLSRDALIVEQDMFFECSAEIIYAFYYLQSQKIVSYCQSAASSAYFRWNLPRSSESKNIVKDVESHLRRCKADLKYYEHFTMQITRFYSKSVINPKQRLALACALIDFAASVQTDEERRIKYCLEITHHFKLGDSMAFVTKIFRILSRSKQTFTP